jgi:hypothetical protein
LVSYIKGRAEAEGIREQVVGQISGFERKKPAGDWRKPRNE